VLFAFSQAAGADTHTDHGLITTPTPEAFSICFSYGCKEVSQLSLQEAEWSKVREIFSPPAPDSKLERQGIARAIAHLESLVGDMTNTLYDQGGTFRGVWSDTRQMDCIDESTNTTTYLKILQHEGLLKWHRVQSPATRGFFIFGWPHTSAVILDTGNNREYAVDSWFHGNGVAPEIVELATWRDGWNPDDNKAAAATTPELK
jgi:hypothetical protein